MSKEMLLNLLQQYTPYDDEEKESCIRMINFINTTDRCFDRLCQKGHITVSVWLLNDVENKVLLTHHKKLGVWLQLGGHADGDSNVYSVALKEASEESGLRNFFFLLEGKIFDIDIHEVPPYKNTPFHYHYDVRFLVKTNQVESDVKISEESNDLKWFSYDDLNFPRTSKSLVRMHIKWKKLLLQK